MTSRPSAIEPYWNRFSSFFLYPLSTEPLLACIAFGLLSGLAALFFVPANRVLELMLLVGALRYGYKVLERTARGYLDDAQVFVEAGHGKHLPYKQFVVVAIGLSLSGLAASLAGPHAGLLLLVLFGLALPANAMLLAVGDDLGESIAPPRLWALMHGIGLPYLGLCACLLLLSGGSGALLGYLSPLVPQPLVGVVGGFVGTYFMVVMFRLMGYALYQYHEVLGLAVDVGFERQAAAVPDDPAARTADLLKAGRYDDALALAREGVASNPADYAANQRLHRLLQAVPGQTAALLAHAGEWLPRLLRDGRRTQAGEVLEAILAAQPDYRPPHAALILPLAEACMAARRYDSATHLIKGFDRRFPGHADTAAVYLLGARLLIEHRRDEAQARRIVAAVRRNYPDSPAAAEAQRLDELLDRLAGTPGTP